MSKYDFIMDIVKNKMAKGADYAKSIPGKLGVDGSSRFDRFARRHADTPLSELENMTNADYMKDDLYQTILENRKPLAIGTGIGGAAGILSSGDEYSEEDLMNDILNGMSLEEIAAKYNIDDKTLEQLQVLGED